MQSEAYKISGFALVAGAVGFLLRWLQDIRIMNEETGLAENAPISWLVAGLMAMSAVVLAVYVLRLARYDMPEEPSEALVGKTGFYGVIAMVPAVLLALAAAYQMLRPHGLWPLMERICGGAKLLGAFGLITIANAASNPRQKAAGRRGTYLLMLFALVWLITAYRQAAAEPIVWRYIVEILAQCVVTLAFFHTMGYFFDVPHTKWALFLCHMGAVLCIMCAIDDNGIAQSLSYGAMAAQLLIWGFVITENLKTRPIVPVRPGEIPTD